MAKGPRAGGAAIAEPPSPTPSGNGTIARSSGGGDPGSVGNPSDMKAEPLPVTGYEGPSHKRPAKSVGGTDEKVAPPENKTPKNNKAPVKPAVEPDEDETPADDDSRAAQNAAGDSDGADGASDQEETIDADLLRQGLDLGYTEEEIRDFGSNAALRRAIAVEDRRMARTARQSRQQTQPGQQQQTRSEERSEPPAQSTKQIAAAVRKLELKLTKDNHDPEALEAFEALRSHYDGIDARLAELESLRGDLNQMGQVVGKTLHDRRIEQFDSHVTKLPAEIRGLLGEGDSMDLPQDSDFFKRRDEIFDTADALQAQYANRGVTLSRYRAVEKAAYSVLSDKLESIARDKVRSEVARRSVQKSTPPTSRQTPEGPRSLDDKLSDVITTFNRKNRLND